MDSLQQLKHKCITTLKTPTPQINCLAVHNSLLYAASVNEINVFDLSNYTHINTFTTNSPTSGSIKSIAFHNTKVFTAHQDCKIRVWQVSHSSSKELHLVHTLPTVKDRLCNFLLPQNYVNVRRHKKRLWIEHWDTVSGLAMHGGLMYSVSWDKSLKIWDVNNNRCLESVLAHQDAVNTVAISDKGTVYTGSADGLIRVWKKVGRQRKHSLVTTLEKHKSTVNALALNGDGSVLFSGGCDRSIMVWERKEDVDEHGNEHNQMVFVEALCGHAGAILCLMNVGYLIVSGSSDQTVRVWQQYGKKNGYCCMVVLEGHERPVKSLVAASNNGLSLSICSGSLDGEIKVWEISAQT
ncbi:protein JINGUBANG [Ricinus communis]|uniref:F-box and wd40 domain protein, putative n=1 Tax=Ricinus communis TaxID=3988 RepID=B9RAQ6_RICCO|nr:protein JINGUBANG [Ricinus communis]EEF51883.1 F-box and wd40 domain protein, putative [Ricinus communis]|eukprot:XP_002511281.1 protein JINGUBANG [Ricinus communis]